MHVSGPATAAASVRQGVSVLLPYWNMPAALDSAVANAGLVRAASPFWYAISGDSTIEDDPGAGEKWVIDELRQHGIQVVPTVTETEDMRDFDRTLASAPRRAAMVHALLTIASGRDYSGLDLDFEDFAVDRGHNIALADEAAARYPVFVAEVCGALHAIGRSCTVTIMPRTTGEQVYWRGQLASWVYDYGALAKVADRVRIMAYDEHAPGGAPGPIAPYQWVAQVVAYARSAMALDKVELALPAYGYDWSGEKTTSITSRQAPQLAVQNGVSPSWNAAQAEDTFGYISDGRRHTVWYEGAMATYDRARLAKAAGFAGIDLWAAGGEDPAVWPMLRALYAH
jgi:spore germination protein